MSGTEAVDPGGSNHDRNHEQTAKEPPVVLCGIISRGLERGSSVTLPWLVRRFSPKHQGQWPWL